MQKKRILIVDDEPDLVGTLQMNLELEDFECLVAHDGNRGFERAQHEKPDLIILDLMLPGMDGYKMCRLLKFDERYKKIPIIMLTARVQSEDRRLGEETGADHYMTKPFSMDELVARIKDLLAV
ncbi:MAG: response regulator transcription factor [Syntrophobacteria bacterium]